MKRKSRNEGWNRNQYQNGNRYEDVRNDKNEIGNFWVWLCEFVTCYKFLKMGGFLTSNQTYYDFIEAVENKCDHEIEVRNELLYILICINLTTGLFYFYRILFGKIFSFLLATLTLYYLIFYKPFYLFLHMRHIVAYFSFVLK